jgi:hypothetical protein
MKREALGMEGFLENFEMVLERCEDAALKSYSMANVNSKQK